LIRGDKDSKEALTMHYITGDQSQELWIVASNLAEREAWEQCIRQNIVAAQLAYNVAESFIQRELFKILKEIAPKVSNEEFEPINKALMKDNYSSVPGRCIMTVPPPEQAPKVSAKEAKKLEKEQEKEKRKAEKEREKAEKEREKAEKKKK